MKTNLFVYGTLTFPEIVYALTGKKFESNHAKLKNFKVIAQPNKPYPILVRSHGSEAQGIILFDVDNISMKKIFDWEDFGYREERVIVSAANKDIDSIAFVWQGSQQDGPTWDREEFEKKWLDEYVSLRIPEYNKRTN